MTVMARLRDTELGNAVAECIYNRELEVEIDGGAYFFVLSPEVHEKFGIDYDKGEMLIYRPGFQPQYGCCWVAQTIDFDFTTMEELING